MDFFIVVVFTKRFLLFDWIYNVVQSELLRIAFILPLYTIR